MEQPELGNKISELRKEKGLTQEELADKTFLNVRSIQRIESGQVSPRMSTLNILSNILDHQFSNGPESKSGTNEQSFMLLILHLSSVFPVVVFAVMIWVLKRDEYPEIHIQGKDVINFQISMSIYLFAASLLAIVLIGIPILIGLGLFCCVISLINGIKAANGQKYKYPMAITFLK